MKRKLAERGNTPFYVTGKANRRLRRRSAESLRKQGDCPVTGDWRKRIETFRGLACDKEEDWCCTGPCSVVLYRLLAEFPACIGSSSPERSIHEASLQPSANAIVGQLPVFPAEALDHPGAKYTLFI